MEWLTTATTAVTTLVSGTLDTITTTPVLAMVFTGTVLMPIGIRLFRKLRRA